MEYLAAEKLKCQQTDIQKAITLIQDYFQESNSFQINIEFRSRTLNVSFKFFERPAQVFGLNPWCHNPDD